MHIFITFGGRGEIEAKNGPEGDGRFRANLKKTITPVGGLQILSPSRILLNKPSRDIHCQNW